MTEQTDAFALSVVKARVFTDNTGSVVEIPVLMTPAGVLEPLLEYCLSRSHDRSLSWMLKRVGSVRLFLEYLMRNPMEGSSSRSFMNFAQRLYTGTFDRATGIDPSGLGWKPRSQIVAQNIISGLTEFFDYLAIDRPDAAKLNPRYAGGKFDRLIDEAAYQHRRSRAFLGHSWAINATSSSGRKPQGRLTRAARPADIAKGEPPAFPEDRFEELLTTGFKVGKRFSYRDILITLLLHGAGFRASEPFHLYTCDVMPDPANTRRALVLIHHPSEGASPRDWRDESGKAKRGNRAAYLLERWGMSPRNGLFSSVRAGWKGGRHEDAYGSVFLRAYWFAPKLGELFLAYWYLYMEELALLEVNSPFAFVNMRGGVIGAPYTLAQFKKAHSAAVRRIGLSITKLNGTTPHGHRHAYGRRLRAGGLEPVHIQRCMHHSSIDSQNIYTQATAEETLSELVAASEKLKQSTKGQTSRRSD